MKKNSDVILLPKLEVAETLWSRTRGLLGTSELSDQQGLWIHRCNSIHTFFMKYAIDCLFLDRRMKVCSIVRNVKPGRWVPPQWGASSVIETRSGVTLNWDCQVGDELNVVN